jgi:retron-type reverse transcriptase
VTIGSFAANLDAELDHLQDRLLSRRYRPFPLLRIEIPKSEAGVRHLAVPTIRDRVLQTAVYHLTRERFEAELEDCSYAFRQGRSVKNAVHRVDELRRQGFRWIVDADIDDFFGRIPHDRLFHRVHRLGLDPYVESLFAAWVEVEIYDGARIYTQPRGIPQGSVVSPMLANLFLDEFDENLALFG